MLAICSLLWLPHKNNGLKSYFTFQTIIYIIITGAHRAFSAVCYGPYSS